MKLMKGFALLFCCTLLSRAADPTPIASAWEVIAQGEKETNVNKHKQFLNALGTAGLNPKTVQILEGSLVGKQVEYRQLAASVLGDIKSRGSIPKLKAALEDEAPEVSFTAARSLWN